MTRNEHTAILKHVASSNKGSFDFFYNTAIKQLKNSTSSKPLWVVLSGLTGSGKSTFAVNYYSVFPKLIRITVKYLHLI